MLIICNGAIKSGSHLLFYIARRAAPHLEVPERYRPDRGNWGKKHIDEARLASFLEEVDYKTNHYVCKSHYDQEATRDLLLEYDPVYVLNIRRDLKDVIVSHYFHRKNIDGIEESFQDYYWNHGRNLVGYLTRYHETWQNRPGKVFNLSYEELLQDYDTQVHAMLDFLDLRLDKKKFKRIKEKSSFEAMRARQKTEKNQKLYRKGTIGDWENHFTEEMKKDYDTLSQRNDNETD